MSTTLAPRRTRHYGWKPDLPDQRDHLAPYQRKPKITEVDLRPLCPPVVDQGQLGSCTANAIGSLVQFVDWKEGRPEAPHPSRLFIYYGERLIEGTVKEDSGAYIRDGLSVVRKLGAPPEKDWPYNIKLFSKKPPKKAYTDGLKHQAIEYMRVTQTLNAMRSCLAAGYPFVIGFTVYESFESDEVSQTGTVPMPQSGESVLGGHAVMVVGYHDESSRFIVRNSWGPGWGDKGYFTIPYAYYSNGNLADDLWTIHSTE